MTDLLKQIRAECERDLALRSDDFGHDCHALLEAESRALQVHGERLLKLCRVIEAQDSALTNLIYQIESDCMEDSAGKTGAGWTFINDIKKARETKAEARRILGGEE